MDVAAAATPASRADPVGSVDAFTLSQPRPGKAASAANAADRPINSLRLIFRLPVHLQLADYPSQRFVDASRLPAPNRQFTATQ